MEELVEETPEKEMSFVDHLEVLRWHILRSVLSIVVFTIIGFISMPFIFREILTAPVRADFWTYRMMCKLADFMHVDELCIREIHFQMQNRSMTGQFSMYIKSAFVFGIICAFPYAFWEIWRFIRPGLYEKEQKGARGAVWFVTILFALGVLFGYYIIAPLSFNFLINFKLDESIPNVIDLTNYISLLLGLVIGSGLMFQLPVLILVLTKIGIVSPSLLRKFRKHSIVGIFILAAIITPSPDFFTQIIVALPMILLYELSIFISAGVYKTMNTDLIKQD